MPTSTIPGSTNSFMNALEQRKIAGPYYFPEIERTEKKPNGIPLFGLIGLGGIPSQSNTGGSLSCTTCMVDGSRVRSSGFCSPP